MKRQQSFGGKNEMKTSQILEGKRQTMNQPSKQFVKQSNVPVKGKTNAVSNNKNVPNFAERNEKNPILKRSNSIQGEGPKAIVHQKNK